MTDNLLTGTARFLNWPEERVWLTARQAPHTYRRYEVPKKSGGGTRSIFHPSASTKSLQYALIEIYIRKLAVDDAATAYRPGLRHPLLHNANQHRKYRYTVKTDLRKFFPSIGPKDLFRELDNWPDAELRKDYRQDRNLLRDALFLCVGRRTWGLAIGAPASPFVSNAVMRRVDIALRGWAAQQESTYSRYADDMVFSTNMPGLCRQFPEKVEAVLKQYRFTSLRLHRGKTVYMSRGTARRVVGLVITPEGNVSIGRERKRYIRKLLHDLKRDRLTVDERRHLQGLLGFVLDVEPSFYDRLGLKYGAEILEQAIGSS